MALDFAALQKAMRQSMSNKAKTNSNTTNNKNANPKPTALTISASVMYNKIVQQYHSQGK